MRLSYIAYSIVAVACLALLPSCKESKPQTEEIVVDKVVDKPHNEVQSMSDEDINGDVELNLLSGKTTEEGGNPNET